MARLRFDTSTCYQMHHVVHSGCVATQQIMLAQDAELNRIFWLGMAADQKLSESELNRFEAFMSGWVQALLMQRRHSRLR